MELLRERKRLERKPLDWVEMKENEWDERLLVMRELGLVVRLELMRPELQGENTEEKWESWQVG